MLARTRRGAFAAAATLALLPGLSQPAAAQAVQPVGADHELECTEIASGRTRCTEVEHGEFRWGVALGIVAGGAALLWGISAWQKRGQKPQTIIPVATRNDFGIALTTGHTTLQFRINPKRERAVLSCELRW